MVRQVYSGSRGFTWRQSGAPRCRQVVSGLQVFTRTHLVFVEFIRLRLGSL